MGQPSGEPWQLERVKKSLVVDLFKTMGQMAADRESQPVAKPLKLTPSKAYEFTPADAADAIENACEDINRLVDPKESYLLA